jgi:dynein heavy chain 1, cytosolic
MMVGPSGSGKSTAWRVLLKALKRFEGIEVVAHVIDPKAISKETLYGVLDPNTREWTDGLFTDILR